MRWFQLALGMVALMSGCRPEGEPLPPPDPKVYNLKVEVISENGEVTQVNVWFPDVGQKVYAENYRDMDALIEATQTVLNELERIRQQMPEGDSHSPPPVVEPAESLEE